WQQVTQLVQALARATTLGGSPASGDTPKLQPIYTPVQVRLPATNSPLVITYNPPSATAETRTQWPIALNPKQQNALAQTLSSTTTNAYLQLRLDPATLTSPRPQVELQLSPSPLPQAQRGSTSQSVRVALHQLPPPLVTQLLQHHRTQLQVATPLPTPQLATWQTAPASAPSNPVGVAPIMTTQQLVSQAVAP